MSPWAQRLPARAGLTEPSSSLKGPKDEQSVLKPRPPRWGFTVAGGLGTRPGSPLLLSLCGRSQTLGRGAGSVSSGRRSSPQ